MSNHEFTRMNTNALPLLLATIFLANIAFAEEKPLYETNFEKAEVGKAPEDFQVIDGQFEVKEENGNKVLELPGAPLDTFGALFGVNTNANIAISAKIFSTGKGRRYPAFAVGLNGVGGYKLQVSPGKKLLELLKGDEVVKSVAYEWKSGEWTEMRLQVRQTKEGQLTVCGKAWTKGAEEPKEGLCYDDTTPGSGGRASIWGSPYSGNPIQYDDLKLVESVGPK